MSIRYQQPCRYENITLQEFEGMNIIISNPIFNFDGRTILLIGIVFIVVIWIKYSENSISSQRLFGSKLSPKATFSLIYIVFSCPFTKLSKSSKIIPSERSGKSFIKIFPELLIQ
ncbi:hypothetical protein [Fusobacterium sp.]|uniref:hypothetical protein n=1 Tax=Fusobacterium sp. TaxID=68766 RepID=UPI00260A1FF9|nr:hypothetical protein [Fusobacterium sp.]